MPEDPSPVSAPAPAPAPTLVKRHRLSTRLWHWINVATVTIMLMSGLMISNAHPRLYWGRFGANPDKAWLELPQFPVWMTIPSHYSPADARLWHLAFAWVFSAAIAGYLAWSAVNGHVWRDLRPRLGELSPAHLWQDIKDHAALRFPTGEAAARYNILQKLAYCGVLIVLLPVLVLTGMALSPALDAAFHWLPELFGGRQSARSVHFLCATGIVLFFIVHIAMVVLAGPVNEVRSMITGWFRLPPEPAAPRAKERAHD
ncbi:cytochrome b/b6 domain-containing protein [Novosphingobium sp.]|uniref:cytochrome b/b6 domain-containing protein n=1 Tax=Novosphingobium sp. TaxID=1874826 RepID=UPI00286E6A1D|nr:cytochrome b/b6 domain-containing protein [Novosphingobium sp.]